MLMNPVGDVTAVVVDAEVVFVRAGLVRSSAVTKDRVTLSIIKD